MSYSRLHGGAQEGNALQAVSTAVCASHRVCPL